METYIVRIRRCPEDTGGAGAVGIVEDAKSGQETRFSGPGELLTILRLASEPTNPAVKARNKGKEKR